MEDYEIFRKVWEGSVPIEFRLDKEGLLSKTETSYFVNLLPLIFLYF